VCCLATAYMRCPLGLACGCAAAASRPVCWHCGCCVLSTPNQLIRGALLRHLSASWLCCVSCTAVALTSAANMPAMSSDAVTCYNWLCRTMYVGLLATSVARASACPAARRGYSSGALPYAICRHLRVLSWTLPQPGVEHARPGRGHELVYTRQLVVCTAVPRVCGVSWWLHSCSHHGYVNVSIMFAPAGRNQVV
jgi:hypothetical protein